MADSICLTIGQQLNDTQPTFQGCPVTISALKDDQSTAGYMCGQVIDDKAWMKQIVKDHQITEDKLLESDRWVVFWYVKDDDLSSELEKEFCDVTRAFIVDADWLEGLGQAASLMNQAVYLKEQDEDRSWISRGLRQLCRVLVPTRHLWLKMHMDVPVKAGAAVHVVTWPNKAVYTPLSDRCKVEMLSSGKMKNLGADNLLDFERWLAPRRREPQRSVRSVAATHTHRTNNDDDEPLLFWERLATHGLDLSTTAVQSTKIKKHDLTPLEGFRLLNRPTKARRKDKHPDKAKVIGLRFSKRTFFPRDIRHVHIKKTRDELDHLSWTAETNHLVKKYQAGFRHQVFWALTEVICSTLVNIIFGILN